MSDSSSGQTPPPESLIDYPQLVDRALRQVVRLALEQVSGGELPGQHYFYISFSTQFPGVEIAADLLAEHPETLSIVLQYQFENLVVGSDHFEVTLYFGGMPKHLVVPYDAVLGFVDPFISFALQFPPLGEEDEDTSDAPPSAEAQSDGGRPSYLRALSDGDDRQIADLGPAKTSATEAATGGATGPSSDSEQGESQSADLGASAGESDSAEADKQAITDADKDVSKDGEDDGSNVVSLDQFRKK